MLIRMKNITRTTTPILLAISLLWAGNLTAQAERPDEYKTIFGSDNHISHGGYGALMINYTEIDNRDAILIGAKGGWLIDHRFTIGLAGYGIASDLKYPDKYSIESVNLVGGYGGLLLEPVFAPNYPVHVSFPVIIGAGGMAYVSSYYDDYHDDWDGEVYSSDAFFVLEPGVEIEFNMVRFMRLCIGASYRYTSTLDLYNTPPDIFDGFNYGLSFKFGKF